MQSNKTTKHLYIAGGLNGSTIAPPVHNFIANSLDKPWTCSFLGAASIDEVSDRFHRSDFAGGLVTMPWKRDIIPYLDGVDDIVRTLGACNCVCLGKDGGLYGTNTDWVGIRDALLQTSTLQIEPRGMVYGAGGASRAAIYALSVELGCKVIYLVNRDDEEVAELLQDVKNYDKSIQPNIMHVKNRDSSATLPPPEYIVSTVPDMEAVTAAELEARAILVDFLSRDGENKGSILDMCYHPLMTRNLRLGEEYGWTIIDGVQAVAYQLKEQWRLWTGEYIQEKEAFTLIRKIAKMREADNNSHLRYE
jgi:quinate dehydrogenase